MEQKPTSIMKYFMNDVLQSKQRTIDIWVFSLEEWEIEESYQHLMFQLGYLLHQSSDYQRFHKLRLLSIVDDESAKLDEEKRLKEISSQARITADVFAFCLNEFDESMNNHRNSNLMSSRRKTDAKCFCGKKKEIDNEKKYELLNAIIKKASKDTSMINFYFFFYLFFIGVLFLTLPPLPKSEEKESEQFLKEISILTDKLPPVLLVHGNESVISLDF